MFKRQQEVKKLLKSAIDVVTNEVMKSVMKHAATNCEFCHNNYTAMEDCPDIKSLIKEFKNLPDGMKRKVYLKIMLQLLQVDPDDSRKLNYMLSLIFESNELRVSQSIDNDSQDDGLPFIRRFGKYIEGIIFYRVCRHFQLYYLHDIVKYATTISFLDLGMIYLMEDALEIVGKHYSCIKHLRCEIWPGKKYTHGMLLKLLFSDPDTQLRRNNCCDTIETLSGLFKTLESTESSDSVHELQKKILSIEALNILLTNVPNLTSIGKCDLKLDELLAAVDSNKVTKIREASFSELSIESFDKMKQVCPDLKILTINKHSVIMLRLLHTCSSIEELRIKNIKNDASIYGGILVASWPTLKTLLIDGNLQVLILDVMANVLRSLEDLQIGDCTDISWDMKSSFKSLKRFNIGYSNFIINLEWFRSFCNTIHEIRFKSSTEIFPDQISTLVTDSYPYLQFVSINPLVFDGEIVKAVVVNCHQLWYFGDFDKNNSTCMEYQRYFRENNVNCELGLYSEKKNVNRCV